MTTAELTVLLDEIRPAMHLCTSDYTAWGDVVSVERPDGASPERAVIVGRARGDGRTVRVPATAALEIRNDKCVRLDAVRAEIDDQGW